MPHCIRTALTNQTSTAPKNYSKRSEASPEQQEVMLAQVLNTVAGVPRPTDITAAGAQTAAALAADFPMQFRPNPTGGDLWSLGQALERGPEFKWRSNTGGMRRLRYSVPRIDVLE